MAGFETVDEEAAMRAAFQEWRQNQPGDGVFRAGWLASRDWHRERDAREVDAAMARLAERGEHV